MAMVSLLSKKFVGTVPSAGTNYLPYSGFGSLKIIGGGISGF
jgi:hypothetical protein